MFWYLVTVNGLHKHTNKEVQIVFRTLAFTSGEATDIVRKAYDWSGVEISGMKVNGEVGNKVWPCHIVESRFIDGPTDLMFAPKAVAPK